MLDFLLTIGLIISTGFLLLFIAVKIWPEWTAKLNGSLQTKIDESKFESSLDKEKSFYAGMAKQSKPFKKPSTYDRLEDWEQDLTVFWQGSPRLAQFSYEKRDGTTSRRKVGVEQVLEDGRGRLYLRGFCHKRIEQRTFNIDRIIATVLENGKRYEVYDWVYDELRYSA